ncbi:HAD family hydrolase [Brevibacillus composti]|uniref:HAD family hydrolase n=1 Tax=Brevibacillus composti TaxID=2796470 RepID=A0A7T5EJM3_9BACL|nr:HAD family hydrolase [Brevibacillus composti]QQE73760.1 HAD family hydrolase [Brevibacillus composti]QUO40843.1 HAD family hydrolase [Brevibacillus composti]
MKLSTILFDLDGTLLEMKTDPFVQGYLQELGQYLGDRYDSKMILGLIWDATKQMIMNQDADKTNEQVFIEAFMARSPWPKEELWPLFDSFYRDVFPKLSHLTHPSPWAKKVVTAAKVQGYRVAVATNPVFPRDAIHSRLAWIELSPEDFELVTVYEESHYTKPNPGYFREIAQKLGVQPEECIMVGNHMQEDMVAGQVGMKTFLVTNWLEDRGEPQYEVDQRGTLAELHEAIVNRTGLFAQ